MYLLKTKYGCGKSQQQAFERDDVRDFRQLLLPGRSLRLAWTLLRSRVAAPSASFARKAWQRQRGDIGCKSALRWMRIYNLFSSKLSIGHTHTRRRWHFVALHDACLCHKGIDSWFGDDWQWRKLLKKTWEDACNACNGCTAAVCRPNFAKTAWRLGCFNGKNAQMMLVFKAFWSVWLQSSTARMWTMRLSTATLARIAG